MRMLSPDLTAKVVAVSSIVRCNAAAAAASATSAGRATLIVRLSDGRSSRTDRN